jgi:hypothetical protein
MPMTAHFRLRDPPVALFEAYGYVRVVERITMVILYEHFSGRINVFI